MQHEYKTELGMTTDQRLVYAFALNQEGSTPHPLSMSLTWLINFCNGTNCKTAINVSVAILNSM